MKILFLSDNFPPEVNAPATRTLEHCIEWVKQGHEVTVITCQPNFPLGRIYDGYQNRWRTEEDINGIRVIRVWSYIAENKGFIKRIADYISFAMTAAWAGRKERPDIVVATSPQFFTTVAGALLSRRVKAPWVFELRDLWPESIKTVGAMKEGFLIRLLERLELWLYRDAKGIIPVTWAFKERLTERGVLSEKQLVIPNGCNTDLFSPRPKDRELLKELNLEGKFVLSYIGTHGMAHSLEFIIRSFSEISPEERIELLLIGAGARKEACVKLVAELGLTTVTLLDPIPKDDVPRYLSVSDLCLAPLIRQETFKTVIPSKIFEAAAMGIPVLLGVEGQAQEIVEEYETGLVFTPEDKGDFLKKLRLLAADSALRKRLSDNTPNLVADYDRRKLATRMAEQLEQWAGLN